MTGESHPERIAKASLPDQVLTPDLEEDGRESPASRDGEAFAFLAVFRHRNYRLFFTGQLVSLMGTWITNVAQAWLVYSLTHSTVLLGLTSFAGQIPVFFLSPFGGMFADRIDRRRLMIVTQSLACLQSFCLAVLALGHWITPAEIVALALAQGFINAFDVPARQGMTVELVGGKEDLRHAISLNSMMFNLARIVGPSLAGILIALVGSGWCFAIDALSYSAVIASLFQMRFAQRSQRRHAEPFRAVRQGFVYAWRNREIRASLLLIACGSMFGASYLSMLPAFARDVLHQGSAGFGLLYGAVGGAALLGAYVLARVPDRHLFITPVAAILIFGVSLIAFSRSHWYWLSFVLLMPSALGMMLLGGATNSIVQLLAREDMRGRVVAFYAMCAMGMMPWGSLLLGWIAARLGVADAIAIGGACCILAGLAAWYDRRGENWSLQAAE